jgi:hypothetical protein
MRKVWGGVARYQNQAQHLPPRDAGTAYTLEDAHGTGSATRTGGEAAVDTTTGGEERSEEETEVAGIAISHAEQNH